MWSISVTLSDWLQINPVFLSLHCFQAGLFALDGGMSLWDILGNPDKISKQLAEQKPLWEPGKNLSGNQVKTPLGTR